MTAHSFVAIFQQHLHTEFVYVNFTDTVMKWLTDTQCLSYKLIPICHEVFSLCPFYLVYNVYWRLIIILRNMKGATCGTGIFYRS
jgi:hypothetical protein